MDTMTQYTYRAIQRLLERLNALQNQRERLLERLEMVNREAREIRQALADLDSRYSGKPH